MKHLIALTAVTAMLAVVGAAGAATVTVSITKNGYVPNASTIAVGDVVQFTNTDTVVHQVTFTQTTGFTCAPSPLVVQPGQSGSCTFQTAGKYDYSDPNGKGKTYSGKVTVAAATPAPAPGNVTLAASPLLVLYGNKATLSGTLSSQKAGEAVQVFAQPCGGTSTAAGSATTTTGGGFSVQVQPLQNTVYTVKVKNTTSPAVTVKVQPRVTLVRGAAHRFTVRVTAGLSFAGKYVAIQRYDGSLRRWRTFKNVALAAKGGVAPTVVSGTSFTAKLKTGLKVRAVLGLAQAGSCSWSGRSNVVTS